MIPLSIMSLFEDGLPPALKQYQYSYSGNEGILQRPPTFISLSKMTFTHPWARSILVEQIYRASEIHKGTGYHKE
jgi:23S rRNA (pseudouridine1915-N3)-methyltransferase